MRTASICVLLLAFGAMAEAGETHMKHPVAYRTVQVDNLAIFYREAGPKDAPTLLLLHGLPSSSRMFEPLFRSHLQRRQQRPFETGGKLA